MLALSELPEDGILSVTELNLEVAFRTIRKTSSSNNRPLERLKTRIAVLAKEALEGRSTVAANFLNDHYAHNEHYKQKSHTSSNKLKKSIFKED